MKYIKIFTLFLVISSKYLYATNANCVIQNEPKIINDLLTTSDLVSPNIVNLCNDLYYKGYYIQYIGNDNIGIYNNNLKLIEIPLDCHQPTVQECSKWSGMQFTNTPYNDIITDLYFNILGFADKQYNNIFENNDKYKHIKFDKTKYTYPLFKIQGVKDFKNKIKQSLRNIIYTDPGKLLMYRLFLASNYLTFTDSIENDDSCLVINLGDNICNEYPIVIQQDAFSRYSYNNNSIGINLDSLSLYCELNQNNKFILTKIGLVERPIETSIYHEFVHCFHHLYYNQILYNNKQLIDTYKENKLLYLFNNNIAVKQAFNIFCEYNNIEQSMDKQTLKTIFNSLSLYKNQANIITSNEEFTTIMGVPQYSYSYYPGGELSENLFRFYVKLPIRDSHMHNIQSPYRQDNQFITNIKTNINNLKLKFSNIKLYFPPKNTLLVKYIPINALIKNNIITQITIKILPFFINVKNINQDSNKVFIKGYSNCFYFNKTQENLKCINTVANTIDLYPKDGILSCEDINNIIDILYNDL